MNNINIGYRIKIDNYTSTKEDFLSFINNFKQIIKCSEIKVTPKLLESNILVFIISNYLDKESYTKNFHIDKNFIYNYNSNLDENRLFSLLEGHKSYLITHLNDGVFDTELYQNIKEISSLIKKNNMLLLENPDHIKDIFEYTSNCNELSKKMNIDGIDNIGFCLDFGHILKCLSNNNISFDSYYSFLLKQKNYLERIKEFHLHDYKTGNDHQVFDRITNNLKNFKKIYLLKMNNTIILENNVSDDMALKQIEVIKGMLLDEN